jgi:hypothetical protein
MSRRFTSTVSPLATAPTPLTAGRAARPTQSLRRALAAVGAAGPLALLAGLNEPADDFAPSTVGRLPSHDPPCDRCGGRMYPGPVFGLVRCGCRSDDPSTFPLDPNAPAPGRRPPGT